jgi:hypothetical protein
MDASRRNARALVHVTSVLVLMAIAGALDTFYRSFADNPMCLDDPTQCRLARFGAAAVFALLAVTHSRFFSTRTSVSFASRLATAAIGLIVIGYPLLVGRVPFLTYYQLRDLPPVLAVHTALAFSEPRSFLMIMGLMVLAAAAIAPQADGAASEKHAEVRSRASGDVAQRDSGPSA